MWFESACVVLFLLVAGAVAHDLRRRIIPNWICGAALVCGLAMHALASPVRGGLFFLVPGDLGVSGAALGALTGLVLQLPLWLKGAVGGGDVKLMAGVGAFIGPQGVLSVSLLTWVVGGLLATGVVLARKRRSMASMDSVAAVDSSMPYAPAIALGMVIHGLLLREGWAL